MPHHEITAQIGAYASDRAVIPRLCRHDMVGQRRLHSQAQTAIGLALKITLVVRTEATALKVVSQFLEYSLMVQPQVAPPSPTFRYPEPETDAVGP